MSRKQMRMPEKEKKKYTGWRAIIRDPRVIVVLILVALSLIAIFVPFPFLPAADRGDSLTNLQFGLDL
ncbi:MAG TPA: preprotein translocase subunit SecD, partial [Methanocorpusculum sp.]|nr:preprotein translocase subunit SecD [Methanocorpusculum sp.]